MISIIGFTNPFILKIFFNIYETNIKITDTNKKIILTFNKKIFLILVEFVKKYKSFTLKE